MDTDTALWATEFLNKHYDLTGLENELTLIFEIISPYSKVIVDYEGQRIWYCLQPATATTVSIC